MILNQFRYNHTSVTAQLSVPGQLSYNEFDIDPPLSLASGLREQTVIYEIRVYEAFEGKVDAMKARFKSEVVKRFPTHGIELLGVFESDADACRLTYLTRFKSEQDRATAWAAFGADPEWRAVKAATEIH